MLEGEAVQDDEGGESYYINSNVGDDEGKKEYPFITSPTQLFSMRKLYDFHKKQLVHDFINCACEYEHCPKGSYLSKETKPSIPGPYYSCPMLHESGDDVVNLPISRRSPRPKTQQPFMRKPKKRASCRKCSLVTFNHYDASMCHENYLKECTYAKLKATNATPLFYARNSTDELMSNPCATSSEQFSDNDEESDSTSPNDSCYPPQWTELKEFIDPWKPLKTADDKKINCTNTNRHKMGKSVTKPVVASRYREISRRQCRPNFNAMHVNNRQTEVNTVTNGKSQCQTGDIEHSKNPFPMPDVFEEIYFGQMPESISTLPVPLQNFKKIQMKVADENSTLRTLVSHKNNPSITSSKDVVKIPTSIVIFNDDVTTIQNSKSHLPPIKKNSSMDTKASLLKGGMRHIDVVSRAIDKINKTAEAVVNKINNIHSNENSSSSRKTVSHTNHHNNRIVTSGGKKRILVCSAIRMSSRKSSTSISNNQQKTQSTHSITKKNKSHTGLNQSRNVLGSNKRKKKISKLTTVVEEVVDRRKSTRLKSRGGIR